MAGPLSVAGLVSLGTRGTGGLVSCIGVIHSLPEDLASANDFINSIQAAISHIDVSGSHVQTSPTANDSIKALIDACKAGLKALEGAATRLSAPQHGDTAPQKKTREGPKRISYAFYRPDIKELEDRPPRAYTRVEKRREDLLCGPAGNARARLASPCRPRAVWQKLTRHL